ncbi:glycoside hydrolase family 3 C-terminal domain-containing protein [Paenibacillus puldeungensis]|uniref:Glycoside hydrolase family 3 C-terminal domain-containing protein n=1 Tax=Paenibacillus puldeungensis TaxID=696536 RepID=A0ABW3RYE1_9BACL
MNRDIKQLIKQLTLEEKAGLCSGADFWRTKSIERLDIPAVMVSDGPHGLRKQGEEADHLGLNSSVPATCFPTAAGMGASWNRDLIRKVGEALGEECQAENVAVLLGPGANIKRSPLCGRNFEYFSEDPYLSSEMAAHHIQGVQSQGVGTSLKHFAANNQEHRRMSVDSVIDERTLREIYLASFEGAVKQSQPWSVMCAYNKVNGEYASENETLLTRILRDEWGFEGFVVSDWGAVNERAKALQAGLELEMPSSAGIGDRKIVEAVKNGTLPEETLDRAVERLLRFVFKAVESKKEAVASDIAAHHALARQMASESMVLLKNDGVLPLRPSASIAIIGEFATNPRYQGGGSSHVNPTKLDDALKEIEYQLAPDGTVKYAQGCRIESDEIDGAMIEEAVQIAAEAEVAVIFAGLPDRYESEGYDRTHLSLPANHLALIEAVAAKQPNVVVVLSNGSPVVMPWIGKVKAVLEGYLGGQAFGGAVADLLFGAANPSGKLAETFPAKLSDNPSFLFFPGEGDRAEYREGVFVGYRYYDTKGIEPLFPFGHGLSYTQFEYLNMELDRTSMTDQDPLKVRVTLKNVGDRAGKEVVQLYVRDLESSVVRPLQELKGFEKIELQPGEAGTVEFVLDKRAFAYYNVDLADWHVESGEFEIRVGTSSRQIALTQNVYVKSSVTVYPVPITRNTLIGDLLQIPQAEAIAKEMAAISGFESMMGDNIEMALAMIKYLPLRGLVAFGQGKYTEEILDKDIQKLNEIFSTLQ